MINKKQLLVETSFDIHKVDLEALKESAKVEYDKDGFLYLEGCIQAFNTKNRNGRIYPKEILMRAVNDYIENNINQFKSFGTYLTPGELDHPDTSTVSGRNISHLVTKIWVEGNKIMGRIKILNTILGKEIQELVKGGLQLGISSRGMGSISETRDDADIVGEDFELICWDIVTDPSTPGAYLYPQINTNGSFDTVESVKKENKNVVRNNELKENLNKIKKIRL
jgi:hypothetical protein